jgi:DNA-directed RNA polymerase subunit RPC12/RpoP
MKQVNCLYCGEKIAEDASLCPHCGARSHFQQRGWRPGARRRFVVLFGLLVVLCFAVALWFPR